MELRDRLANLALFAAAAVAWAVVAVVLTTRDPLLDREAGLVGAAAIGVAAGLSTMPLFWLAAFGRNRGVAYRGEWVRAIRRGGWLGAVSAFFIALRVEGAFQLPIALFVLAMVVIAEAT
ncbi:MAG: hypothetical protein FJ038_13895, partial [Chloroflexi bacterium]|nr:hypothetical protein [Chloroflexota bacterium]